MSGRELLTTFSHGMLMDIYFAITRAFSLLIGLVFKYKPFLTKNMIAGAFNA